MQTDPVFIEIITAANLAGIEQARVGLLGFAPSTLALAAGLGVLVGGTKAAVDVAEAHATALGRLKQASDVAGIGFDSSKTAVENFTKANQQFIPDNNKAIESFAMLLRSTGDQKLALEALRVVMNLTAITGKDWDTSTQAVNLGLQGSGRSLRELGIDVAALKKDQDNLTVATKDLTKAKAEVEKATREHDVAERRLEEYMVQIGRPGYRVTTDDLMKLQDRRDRVTDTSAKLKTAEAELATAQTQVNGASKLQTEILQQLNEKTKNGADTTSEFHRQVNILNGRWQEAANTMGGVVLDNLGKVIKGVNEFYTGMDKIGKDDAMWGTISKRLTEMALGVKNAFPNLPAQNEVVVTGPNGERIAVAPDGSRRYLSGAPSDQKYTGYQNRALGPGEYVDPTGKVYSFTGNPQEQQGPAYPGKPRLDGTWYENMATEKSYQAQLKIWQEAQQARLDAQANAAALQRSMDQIANGLKQRSNVYITVNASGQDVNSMGQVVTRAIRQATAL